MVIGYWLYNHILILFQETKIMSNTRITCEVSFYIILLSPEIPQYWLYASHKFTVFLSLYTLFIFIPTFIYIYTYNIYY